MLSFLFPSFTMPVTHTFSFHHLLLHELYDLYDAEHRILEALPAMIKNASSRDLREGFTHHRKQTEGHVRRLEEMFSLLHVKPKRQKCDGMEGLLKEGEKILKLKMDPAVCDAALISAAQRVEHYEIAAYGCARAFAETMGHKQVADLLQETLEEEAETDRALTDLAERTINEEAAEDVMHDEKHRRAIAKDKSLMEKVGEAVGVG